MHSSKAALRGVMRGIVVDYVSDGIEGVKLLMCADRAGAPEAKR